jgi:hypothetical protein
MGSTVAIIERVKLENDEARRASDHLQGSERDTRAHMARVLAEGGANDSARVVFAPALQIMRDSLMRQIPRPSFSHFSVEEEVKALVAMGDDTFAFEIARFASDETEKRKILCSIAEALVRAGRTDDALRVLTQSRTVSTPDDAHP